MKVPGEVSKIIKQKGHFQMKHIWIGHITDEI